MIFVQTQGHEALSLYWTFHGIVCCFLEFYCIGWINHTHRVVHDSFYFGSYSVKSECTLGNRHWCKAICRTGSLYIGQREWDPFATFFWGGGTHDVQNVRILRIRFIQYTASGDCRRSWMLFTRSSTRQGTDFIAFYIDIRSITISLCCLLVNSCLYVWAMLNTRFIYCLSQWSRSAGRYSQWTISGSSFSSFNSYTRCDPAQFRTRGQHAVPCRRCK